MGSFEYYELLRFELEGQIDLGEKRGLIKIGRSEDDHIILFCNALYSSPSLTEATPLNVADLDAVLGFVLDIGIRRTKWLTRDGFYFGMVRDPAQSLRKVKQSDFDATLFDKLVWTINRHYQSGDSKSESLAVRTNYLLQAYNNSRLLFPNFHNECYLGLLRIIDAITKSWGADEFAISAAEISPVFNSEVYEKVAGIAAFRERRLDVAEQVFSKRLECLHRRKKASALVDRLQVLTNPARLIFSCLYSAYQYRNKFVHYGLPFPYTLTLVFDPEEDTGTNYLNPVEGISFRTKISPRGVQPGDVFDFHEGVEDAGKAAEFKNSFFRLLPTWHFLSRLARKAIVNELERISES